MQVLIESISLNRIVSLVGSWGIGKSTILREISHYIFERNFFKDGIIFIEECTHIESLIWDFQNILGIKETEDQL